MCSGRAAYGVMMRRWSIQFADRLVAVVAVMVAVAAEMAQASAGADVTAAPLPSSALMGMALIGGVAAFARFPQHKRRRRKRRW